MELIPGGTIEAESSSLVDAQALNVVKNRLRDVTRLSDAAGKAYPQPLEAHQLKHEVGVLLAELHIHGLLPQTVSFVSDPQAEMLVAQGAS